MTKNFRIVAWNFNATRTPWRTYDVTVKDTGSKVANVEAAYREAYRLAEADDFLAEFKALEWGYRVTCQEMPEGQPVVTRVSREATPLPALQSSRKAAKGVTPSVMVLDEAASVAAPVNA